MGSQWTEDPMDDDIDDVEDGVSEESEDNENDSEEVKSLKVSRFFFMEELGSSFVSVSGSSKILEKTPSIC